MKRFGISRLLVCGFVALGVLVAPVIAEELLGVLTKVDVESKKVTVESKDGAETVVTINEKTEYVTPKGSDKIDLEKVSKTLERVQEKGRKGIQVKVTHEKGVASKIEVEARKKGEGKKKTD